MLLYSQTKGLPLADSHRLAVHWNTLPYADVGLVLFSVLQSQLLRKPFF